MFFTIVSDITNIGVIAQGSSVRSRRRLRARYGGMRWRKMKGEATVRFIDGSTRRAEIHWYEAHGVGRRDFKIKRSLG
jgi:hypothetical protein